MLALDSFLLVRFQMVDTESTISDLNTESESLAMAHLRHRIKSREWAKVKNSTSSTRTTMVLLVLPTKKERKNQMSNQPPPSTRIQIPTALK